MTERTKHTPGPWRLVPMDDPSEAMVTEAGYVASEHGGCVPIRTPFREDAFRGDNRSDHSEEEVVANLHLIAAAPTMLAAIEKAVSLLDRHLGDSDFDEERDEDEDPVFWAMRVLVAAIAKAEGRDA